jgi:hypothetical protein
MDRFSSCIGLPAALGRSAKVTSATAMPLLLAGRGSDGQKACEEAGPVGGP